MIKAGFMAPHPPLGSGRPHLPSDLRTVPFPNPTARATFRMPFPGDERSPYSSVFLAGTFPGALSPSRFWCPARGLWLSPCCSCFHRRNGPRPVVVDHELSYLLLLHGVRVDSTVLATNDGRPKLGVFAVEDNGRCWLERDLVYQHATGQQPDTSPDQVFKVRRHLPGCLPEQRPRSQVAKHQSRSGFCLGQSGPHVSPRKPEGAWLRPRLQRELCLDLRCEGATCVLPKLTANSRPAIVTPVALA